MYIIHALHEYIYVFMQDMCVYKPCITIHANIYKYRPYRVCSVPGRAYKAGQASAMLGLLMLGSAWKVLSGDVVVIF